MPYVFKYICTKGQRLANQLFGERKKVEEWEREIDQESLMPSEFPTFFDVRGIGQRRRESDFFEIVANVIVHFPAHYLQLHFWASEFLRSTNDYISKIDYKGKKRKDGKTQERRRIPAMAMAVAEVNVSVFSSVSRWSCRLVYGLSPQG